MPQTAGPAARTPPTPPLVQVAVTLVMYYPSGFLYSVTVVPLIALLMAVTSTSIVGWTAPCLPVRCC